MKDVLEIQNVENFFKHLTSVSAQINQLNTRINHAVLIVRINNCGMLMTNLV